MNQRMLDEDFLTGTEDQIRMSIGRLLNPPRNRILTNDQWWGKCIEIDNQILIAIKDDRLPKELRISNFVRNVRDYFLKGIVTKPDYIRQFQAVSDHLQEQEQQPDEVRHREYKKMMEHAK